ncbi:MAG: tyrosine-type recombinase/integrase, partial [Synechococcales bacterium]|nr:tyrosine-type recombinase/integrase [Synechococcales bacterium]
SNTPINQQAARAKAAEIERDIALQQFDPSLEKYRPTKDTAIVPALPNTVEQWQHWMDKRRGDGVAPQTLANRYQTILNLLIRFQRNIETVEDARALVAYLTTRQSPVTVNRNLAMLSAFATWSADQGWIVSNPFIDIKPLKASSPNSSSRKPFTIPEMQAILVTFKTHPIHYVYHDFALTLFTLGLRPSEAIGLRWQHVDFTTRTILIRESLSRGGEGSRRVRKGRKNGTETLLSLPDSLYTMLQGRLTPEVKPDDLIFTTPKGKAIDDHNFSQRVWRTILKQAGIPHRPPYNCRHSMASHAIEQGATFPAVAYLLGHRDNTMVSKIYGHLVNRPKLPDLDL